MRFVLSPVKGCVPLAYVVAVDHCGPVTARHPPPGIGTGPTSCQAIVPPLPNVLVMVAASVTEARRVGVRLGSPRY